MTESKIEPCDVCGETEIHEELQTQEFLYGSGRFAVTLYASVPTIVCNKCGFSFSDYRGEEIRHEAVCHHLGVLTPKAIVGIREKLGLSRAEFAEIIGVGIASLQRWETGSTLQNTSIDNLIRLASSEANIKRLKQRSLSVEASIEKPGCSNKSSHVPLVRFIRFTNLPQLEMQAKQWPLRPRRRQLCT